MVPSKSMVPFKNKVVVITGACAGIGRALALRFGEGGARVVLLDICEDQLAAFQEHLSSRQIQARSFHCNIGEPEQVQNSMNQILGEFGTIDVLINNAGITHHSAFVETELSVFRRIMDINYYGALYCTKAALPILQKSQGQIITISSMFGFSPHPLRSAYSASKHALHGLFSCLRMEVRSEGVHVMLVCPGATATDIHRKALSGDGSVTHHPLDLQNRASSPADVANEVYLAAVKRRNLLIVSNIDWKVRFFARLFPAFFERYLAHRYP